MIWNTYGKLGFVTRAVNFFQEVAECCGVLGPEDWVDSAWYKPPSIFKVPKSCCQVRHTFYKNVYSPKGNEERILIFIKCRRGVNNEKRSI